MGIRVRVISGTEEARLIHLAAAYAVGVGRRAVVVIDIGGGSTEITLGTASRVELGRSFKLGVIRLTERFVQIRSADRPRRAQARPASYARDARLPRDRFAKRGFERVIGTSGTILVARRARRRGAKRPPGEVRQPARQRQGDPRVCAGRLTSMTLDERLQLPGLDPRRADLAVAGGVLLDTLLGGCGADEITLCDFALREGLVLDYIQSNARTSGQVDRYPDVRRRSVVELGRAVQLLAGARAAGRAAGAGPLRRDARRARPGRPRARVARVRRAPARHRRAHQLRAAPQAFVLPDQERRPARLRAGRGRDHRARRALSPAGDAQEGRTTASATLPRRRGAPSGCSPPSLRLAEGLDRSHAQAVAGVDRVPRQTARLRRPAAAGRRRRTGAVGRAPPRGAARSAARPPHPLRSCAGAQAAPKDPTAHAQQPRPRRTSIRASCSSSKASTARARRRSSALLAKWLSADRPSGVRHRMELVGARQGGHQDRQEEERADADDVQPAARDGLRRPAALQDHSAAQGRHDRAGRSLRLHGVRARRARGVDRQWVRELYSFAVQPDLAVYFRVPIDVSLDRLLARRVKLKFYEAGMDMGWSAEPDRELPAVSGQGARRVRPARATEFGLERDRRGRQHHRPAAACSASWCPQHLETDSTGARAHDDRRRATGAHGGVHARATTTATASRTCRSTAIPGKLIAIEGTDGVGRSHADPAAARMARSAGLRRGRDRLDALAADAADDRAGQVEQHAQQADVRAAVRVPTSPTGSRRRSSRRSRPASSCWPIATSSRRSRAPASAASTAQWIRSLYGFAIAPHLVFYLKIDAKTLIAPRARGARHGLLGIGHGHEAGDDIYDSFRSLPAAAAEGVRVDGRRVRLPRPRRAAVGRTRSRTSCAGRSASSSTGSNEPAVRRVSMPGPQPLHGIYTAETGRETSRPVD